MGVSDKLWFKVTCTNCKNTETCSVLDKGSGWGGPSWQSSCSFETFTAQFKGGGKSDPEVVSAICKKCSGQGTVETSYGFNRPNGF